MKKADSNAQVIPMVNRLDERLIRATLTNIEWERIICHMTIDIETSENFDPTRPLDFYLVAAFYKANAKLKVDEIDGNTYHLSVNVTNPGYCLCIPTGTYALLICQGNDVLCNPEIGEELAPNLFDKSRTFLHNNKTQGYCVNFSCSDSEEELTPVITIMDMKKGGLRIYNTDDRPETRPTFRKKFMKYYNRLRRWGIKVIYAFFYHWHRLVHRKRTMKTIMFMSEQSEELSTNIMSVYDRMVERGMVGDQYRVLFSARATVANPHYGVPSWLKMLNKIAQAQMIFLDDHAPVFDWLFLKDTTTLIQLWHAGAGFKSSGYSRWGHNGCPAPYGCHRQYKYGIAGSRYIAHFFSEVFGINTEQILPTGMPRMDEYNDPEHRREKEKEIHQQYPLINGKKVILFAPTYRGTNHFDAHYPYQLIDFDRLYKFCGDEYVVMFKMHPWVADPVPIPEQYLDKFVDVGRYPNINDLFYVVDLLITDYSSNIFEFSLMRKPMLFFAFDEIQYSFSRGFHRPYEESAPGKVCHTFAEVMDALENQDFEYEKVERYVTMQFDHIDSHACDRVIDWILLGNIPQDIQEKLDEIASDNALLHVMDFSSVPALHTITPGVRIPLPKSAGEEEEDQKSDSDADWTRSSTSARVSRQ